jgi:hypothetical protein
VQIKQEDGSLTSATSLQVPGSQPLVAGEAETLPLTNAEKIEAGVGDLTPEELDETLGYVATRHKAILASGDMQNSQHSSEMLLILKKLGIG